MEEKKRLRNKVLVLVAVKLLSGILFIFSNKVSVQIILLSYFILGFGKMTLKEAMNHVTYDPLGNKFQLFWVKMKKPL